MRAISAYSRPLSMPPVTKPNPGEGQNGAPKGERIAKVMARAGLCSRREAERWIAAHRVAVDGKVLTTPAFLVTRNNRITVDGVGIPENEPVRMWRVNKPLGLLTTHRDPEGRPTLFEQLPKNMPRVISIGRLDINSEGLLLLTNDGELARKLELPATGWTRRYRVRVHGQVDEAKLAALAGGVEIEGIKYAGIRADLDRKQGANAWLTMALVEGKNREIRKIMEHLELKVNRLIRVAYGPFQLGALGPGQVDEVPQKTLAEQLGWDKAAPGAHSRRKK